MLINPYERAPAGYTRQNSAKVPKENDTLSVSANELATDFADKPDMK